MTDDVNLSGLLQTIREGVDTRGLIAYEGMPSLRRALAVVQWEGDWSQFLDVAQRARATLIYLCENSFDWETDLRDAASEVELLPYSDETGDDTGAEAEAWVMARLREQTEEWAVRRDEPSSVACVWVRDGVAHSFHREATWRLALEAAVEEVIAAAQSVAAENRRLDSEEEAKRQHDRADEMARHPRYLEATSEAKREFMAQQLYPQLDPFECRRIGARSALIYWWEVEPTERMTKEERARELYAAGENIRNIVAILKISEPKVRVALGDRLALRWGSPGS